MTILSIDQLTVQYGNTLILRQLSLNITEGQIVGLIGRNGAGKTTLLRTLMGQIRPHAGTILFKNKNLNKTPPHQRAALQIGYMPEDRRLVPSFTVEENLRLPIDATRRRDGNSRLQWIYQFLPELSEWQQRPATQLSGGQQKIVALARALMIGQTLLLLDEPTEGIAPVLIERIIEVLQQLKQQTGLTILIAESNAKHYTTLLDKTYIIERGALLQSENL